MALFGRRKTTVGLDVGSGLIKIAVIDHGKGAPELRAKIDDARRKAIHGLLKTGS